MDDLLELFRKYRCHLNRGNVPMSEFLESNFSDYIKDLEIAKTISNNQLVGERVCKMVEEKLPTIIENSRKIVEVHRIVHGFGITSSNGEQILATKTRTNKGNEQFVITQDYLMDFIKKNKELSNLLYEYRGY